MTSPSEDLLKKAFVKTLPEDNRVEIKLKYVNPSLGLDRFFVFNRLTSDSVEQIKSRIFTNIERASLKHRRKNKKKSPTNAEDFKLDVEIIHDGNVVEASVIFQQLLELKNVSISVDNQIFPFYINPPEVKQLKLPSSFLAGFSVTPLKLELENCTVDDCELRWFKNSKAAEPELTSWIPIGNELSYPISNEDIGYYLKLDCLPKKGENQGLKQSIVSSVTVEAGPGQCPFDLRHNFTRDPVNHSGLRVVTYNILADLYADSDYTRTVLHPYCPPYALAIDYRIQLILKELQGYNADILCLQEVDSKVFNTYLEPTFARLGFSGVFAKKGGDVSEGMSCIFNSRKFKHVESYNYILSQELPTNSLLSDLWCTVQQNEKLKERLLKRTTACQIVVMDVIGQPKRLVVANTHLYFHPDADHIRLLQATIASRLAQHISRTNMSEEKDACLLFCGDFNSCPGYGVLEFMTEQFVEQNCSVWASNPEEVVRDLAVHNPCAMETACGTPPFTNYTPFFNGCLDYIFYEKSKFVVEQVKLFSISTACISSFRIDGIFLRWFRCLTWRLLLKTLDSPALFFHLITSL